MSEQAGLQAKVAAVDEAVARLESSISKNRAAKIIAVLIILVTVGMVAHKYYSLVSDLTPETMLDEITGKLQERQDDYIAEGKAILEECREPVTAAIKRSFEKNYPRITALAGEQARGLVDSTSEQVRTMAKAEMEKFVDKNTELIAGKTKIDDKKKLEDLVQHFQEAMTQVGNQLISDHYRTAIQNMRDSWDKFEAKPVKKEEEAAVPDIIKELFVQMFVQKFTAPVYMQAAAPQKTPVEQRAPRTQPGK